MKIEKFKEMSAAKKLEYLIKKLGKKEVLDYLADCFNEHQLEFITSEMADEYCLIEY